MNNEIKHIIDKIGSGIDEEDAKQLIALVMQCEKHNNRMTEKQKRIEDKLDEIIYLLKKLIG